MKHFCSLSAGLTFLLLLSFSQNADAQEWVTIRRENGIQVLQKEVEGRDLPIFRGRTTVNANIFHVLGILADIPNHCRWMHGCHSTRSLKVKTPLKRLSYNRTKTPWPLDDRDVVLESEVKVDRKNKRVTVHFKAVRSSLQPEIDGIVRMVRLQGYYRLTAKGAGKTAVQYQVDADPGGNLPAWAIRMASEDIPYNTLTNLRRRAKKMEGKYQAFIDRWDPRKNPDSPAFVVDNDGQ